MTTMTLMRTTRKIDYSTYRPLLQIQLQEKITREENLKWDFLFFLACFQEDIHELLG